MFIKDKVVDRCQIYKSIFIKLAICTVIYGLMMSESLFNRQDGMWMGTYYYAGDWELSLGRWAWRYLDIIHCGVTSHPITTIITLMMFIIGTTLLTKLFNLEMGRIYDIIVSILFLENVAVCCSISYLYMSQTFGLAFLLAIASIYFSVYKYEQIRSVKAIIGYISSILAFAVFMGLYQENLGCWCLIGLSYLILITVDGSEWKDIGKNFLRLAITAIAGIIIYAVVLNVELKRYNVQMANYNGASNVSLSNIIMNLETSLPKAYINLFNYLNNHAGAKWNVLPGSLNVTVSLMLLIIIVLFSFMKSRDIVRTVVILIATALIPVAINAVRVLIPESHFIEQQTGPSALFFPVLILLSLNIVKDCKLQRKKFFRFFKEGIIMAISLVLIWGTLLQTQIDQEAIRQGTNAGRTLCNSVISKLIDMNLYSSESKYAFVGAGNYSQIIRLNEVYNKANNYAKILGPYWGGDLDNRTWNSLFRNVCGVNISRCDSSDYENLIQSDVVHNMPLFPDDGSIQIIDEIVVIKISN